MASHIFQPIASSPCASRTSNDDDATPLPCASRTSHDDVTGRSAQIALERMIPKAAGHAQPPWKAHQPPQKAHPLRKPPKCTRPPPGLDATEVPDMSVGLMSKSAWGPARGENFIWKAMPQGAAVTVMDKNEKDATAAPLPPADMEPEIAVPRPRGERGGRARRLAMMKRAAERGDQQELTRLALIQSKDT